MYGSPARMRLERESARRSNASVVITTLLSLLVVVAAVAVVAYLVLRTPSAAVDSAERLDPVGTALPAPTDPPTLPTAVPTESSEPDPQPTALGFTGEQPAVSGLPTVAAPEQAPEEVSGPTPTPRVIAQPTEPPPTPVPAAPTLPPSVPVTQVPVVALQPVEAGPPPAPTSAPAQTQPVSQPTPARNANDDDPFDILDDENDSRIVPAVEDPQERVRALQDEIQNSRPNAVPTLAPGEERRRDDDDSNSESDIEIPDIVVPTPEIIAVEPRTVTGRDGSVEVVVPDVDAMIDEITARTTDPNRNPNVSDAARRALDDDEDDDQDAKDQDDEDQDERRTTNGKKRKSVRDRIKERIGQSPGSDESPITGSNGSSDSDNDSGVCTDPTAPGFPFDC